MEPSLAIRATASYIRTFHDKDNAFFRQRPKAPLYDTPKTHRFFYLSAAGPFVIVV